MGYFTHTFKVIWQCMFEPPWSQEEIPLNTRLSEESVFDTLVRVDAEERREQRRKELSDRVATGKLDAYTAELMSVVDFETVRAVPPALHWIIWLYSWIWTLAGLALGALVAPWLAGTLGPSITRFQDAVDIGVAVLGGIAIQILGWLLFALVVIALTPVSLLFGRVRMPGVVVWPILLIFLLIALLLPLACVGVGVYRYLNWEGVGQRSVALAFAGGLVVKSFFIPFLKGIVTGALFKWFMNWLRGDKAKVRDA